MCRMGMSSSRERQKKKDDVRQTNDGFAMQLSQQYYNLQICNFPGTALLSLIFVSLCISFCSFLSHTIRFAIVFVIYQFSFALAKKRNANETVNWCWYFRIPDTLYRSQWGELGERVHYILDTLTQWRRRGSVCNFYFSFRSTRSRSC